MYMQKNRDFLFLANVRIIYLKKCFIEEYKYKIYNTHIKVRKSLTGHSGLLQSEHTQPLPRSRYRPLSRPQSFYYSPSNPMINPPTKCNHYSDVYHHYTSLACYGNLKTDSVFGFFSFFHERCIHEIHPCHSV